MQTLTPVMDTTKTPPGPSQAKSMFGAAMLPVLLLCCAAACTSIPPLAHEPHNTRIVPPILSLTIMQIQGSESSSAYVNQRIRTTGIITLFSKDQQHFWLQDPLGDNNQHTSDGIFVDAKQRVPHDIHLTVGDHVQFTALVQERQFTPALPLTMLSALTELKIIRSQQLLPTPVMIKNVPDVSIPEAIQFWERLEGMRVAIQDATVVGPTNRYGEFVVLAKENRQPGSGYEMANYHLLLRNLGKNQVDYNPERIMIDDNSQLPALNVRPGDRITTLRGVVQYSYDNYKIEPEVMTTEQQPPPAIPVTDATTAEHNLSIASFNLENFFATLDKGAAKNGPSKINNNDFNRKLNKLVLAIKNELRLPAIIVVQEAENIQVLQILADRINHHTSARYSAVSYASSDRRGIETGFLWDTNKVTLLKAWQLHTPQTLMAFGDHSASPGREPLVGRFRLHNQELLVIGNHFKSKRGDDPLFGIHQPAQRPTEVQRKAQARAVRDYVNELLAADPDALIVLSGDFNDHAFAEPDEGADHPLAILTGGPAEIKFTHVAEAIIPAERFSYIHHGNAQLLDHMLLSPAMQTRLRGARLLHINASFPAFLEQDPTTPLRSSDHDPLISYFQF